MKAVIAILLFVYVNSMQAQEEISIDRFCAFSRSEQDSCGNTLSLKYNEINDSDTLKVTLQRVLEFHSLKGRMSIGTVANPNINGLYCKPAKDGIPRILINKKHVTDYWKAMGILLHELGHYLNDHENLCSNLDLESDADLFAGRTLAFLKANKQEALSCLSVIPDNQPPSTQYPPKRIRIEQLIKGYDHYLNASNPLSFTSINPRVIWKEVKDGYDITIDQRDIKVPKLKGWMSDASLAIDPNLGILYYRPTNATYQLYNYGRNKKGLGQLVNDRTALTYMRIDKDDYRIYSNSKIVRIDELVKPDPPNDGTNYIIIYRDNGVLKQVVLVDFFHAPYKRLMPAFYQ